MDTTYELQRRALANYAAERMGYTEALGQLRRALAKASNERDTLVAERDRLLDLLDHVTEERDKLQDKVKKMTKAPTPTKQKRLKKLSHLLGGFAVVEGKRPRRRSWRGARG